VFYILWSVLHIVAAFFILEPALAPLEGMEPSAANGRIYQNSGLMFTISVASIVIAVVMNWRNNRLGHWLQVILVGGTDVAFIAFVLIPGYEPLSVGWVGPTLWLIALGLSSAARLVEGDPPAVGKARSAPALP
jgi:hypothetical protein